MEKKARDKDLPPTGWWMGGGGCGPCRTRDSAAATQDQRAVKLGLYKGSKDLECNLLRERHAGSLQIVKLNIMRKGTSAWYSE